MEEGRGLPELGAAEQSKTLCVEPADRVWIQAWPRPSRVTWDLAMGVTPSRSCPNSSPGSGTGMEGPIKIDAAWGVGRGLGFGAALNSHPLGPTHTVWW